jgi:hypothetical protein
MKSPRQWWREHWRVTGEATFYTLSGGALLGILLIVLRRTMALHADGLWVFSLVQDVLNGTPVRGWKPSALPLYFPELTSVFVLRAAGLGVQASILAYGVMSWAAVTGGVYWGARLCSLGRLSALKVAFSFLLIGVFLHARNGLIATFQNPFSHGGSTLGTFLGLVFIGRCLRDGAKLTSAIFGGVCLALLVASDLAIVVQFVVPALACLAVFWLLGWAERRRIVWMIGALAAGTLCGRLITRSVEAWTGLAPEPLRLEPSLGASSLALSRIVEDLAGVARENPLLLVGALLPMVVLAQDLAAGLRMRRRAELATAQGGLFFEWWMTWAALASLCATVAGVVVSNAWSGLASHRYILPILILPVPFVLIVAARRLSLVSQRIWRVGELAVLALAVLVGKPAGASLSALAGSTPPKYACLDYYAKREGLHAGYAQFWHARPPTVFSEQNLTINQVDSHWKPYFWLNNAFWYSRGYWPGQRRPLQYDFAITNGLDEQWLTARFGEPRAKRSCFDLKVWVYDRPQDAEFRNYLRSYAARTTGDRDGWWESPALADKVATGRRLGFDGAQGVVLEAPHVQADVVEIASPTRKELSLTYRTGGVAVAEQRIEFGKHERRLVPIPVGLDGVGFDSVIIKGLAGGAHELTEFVLMVDRGSFRARPASPRPLNEEVAQSEVVP